MANEVKIVKSDDAITVYVTGSIDEDFRFEKYRLENAKIIEIHLERLTSINSIGLREWIRWVESMPSQKIAFYGCPKVIVEQMNRLKGFLPLNGIVKSFFVPYYNSATDAETLVLYRDGHEYKDGTLRMPEVKDADGTVLTLDVNPDYFRFLKK